MKRYCKPLLLFLALLSLVSCSEKKPEPLRIGTNAWPGYEFLHLAAAKGFFEEAGVDVMLLEFSSLADCRRAYERGQLDGMACTVIEVLQARDQSRRSPQIVQVVDYSDGGDVILGSGAIQSGKELRGKRIGVELASLGVYVMARGLEELGLDMESVEVVSTDQLSMEEALKNGEIDAAVTYPPTSIRLLREPGVQVLFSTKQVPGEVVDVIAMEKSVCDSRQGDVQAVIHSFNRAVKYARQHPDDAHAIMAKRQGITTQEFSEILSDGIVMVGADEQSEFFKPGGKLEQVVERSDKVLRKTGQLDGPDRRVGIVRAEFVSGGGIDP